MNRCRAGFQVSTVSWAELNELVPGCDKKFAVWMKVFERSPTEINECWEAAYLWGSRTKHLVLCTNHRLCHTYIHTPPHTLSHHRFNCKLSTPNRSEIICLKEGYSSNLFLRCCALKIQAMYVQSLSLNIYSLVCIISYLTNTSTWKDDVLCSTYSVLVYYF